MRFILFILSLAILPLSVVQSQIIETAPLYNHSLKAHAYKQSISNPPARQTADTLNLPFMDDFSYEGPHPRESNWVEHSVFVNNTLSVKPPSVGVATFDGLDHTGAPYGTGGSGDTLTSCPFYLEQYAAGPDSVYLSFYYQPKGKGDKPELDDSLILEFKDGNGNWNNAGSWSGIPPDSSDSFVPDFSFSAAKVPDSLLYDGFQFRFRNLSSGKGQVDLWHLDYIRLVAADDVPTRKIKDIAFTEAPTTFLKSYESMPWRHFAGFESTEATDSFSLSLRNHSDQQQDILQKVFNVKEITNNINVLNTSYAPLLNVDGETLLELSEAMNVLDYNSFIDNLQSQFVGATDLVFETRFGFTENVELPEFPSTFENNNIFKRTVFGDYFAYDDGTAESNVKAQNQGTDVAVRFHANVPDSIKAFQIHIPHVSVDASLQLFNLKIYLDLDEDPIYSADFQSPVYVDEIEAADTLQGFTTYVLKDILGNPSPIAIPAGDFYIGWEQGSATDNPIPVGFDKNNSSSGVNNFYNTGTGWEPFPATLQGAILLRPIVGDAEVISTAAEDLAAETFFNIYPNPADEVLVFNTLDGEDFEGGIEIFDVAGKRVLSSEYQEFIPVINLSNGIYFVQLTEWETSIRYNMKIVVQH